MECPSSSSLLVVVARWSSHKKGGFDGVEVDFVYVV